MTAMKPDHQNQTSKDDWSQHWQTYAKSASENPAQKMRHNMVLKVLQDLPSKPELLLDIGSGQGDFLCKAAANNSAKKYVGFELSETGVNISRPKVPQAQFIQANLFSPPAMVSQFIGQGDVVVCSEVIEHVDEPEKFCRLLKTYLKPGAYLLLTVPGGPMSDYDRHIGHRIHYDQVSITRLLVAAGFNVDKVVLAGFPFFNLYRMIVISRGKRLILEVASQKEGLASGFIANLMMRIFRILFRLNVGHSRFGWQVFAVARRLE